MDRRTALKALSLPVDASAQDIEEAYVKKIALFKKRIEQASTDALKHDFNVLIGRLEKAYEYLKTAPVVDVPVEEEEALYSSAIYETEDPSLFTDNELDAYLNAHKKSSLRKSILGLSLFTLITLIGIGFFSGFIQELWHKYRPLTAEEKAAMQASIELTDIIAKFKQELEDKRASLEEEVRISGEANDEPLHSMLSEMLMLADSSVFKSLTRLDLEREEREAQDKFDTRYYLESHAALQKVEQGYIDLRNTLARVEKVVPEKYAALAEREKWNALENEFSPHGLSTPEQIAKATDSFSKGEENVEALELEPALDNFADAKDNYIAAQTSVADEIAAIKERLAKARAKRKSISAERIAWLKSVTPPLVDIPAGKYTMGSKPSETADEDEMPAHKVWISAFKLSKYEITKEYFQKFVDTTGYKTEAEKNDDGLGCAVFGYDGSWQWREGYHWNNAGYPQDKDHPAVCISWNDAEEYAKWLSKEWGSRKFRLVSESEWEYAARAGTRSEYFSGKDLKGKNLANCDGCGSQWDVKGTAPTDSFRLNNFGLHAMYGNVFEWVRDCWHENYKGAPSGNSAWFSNGECDKRVLRGGSWFSKPKYLRSAYRSNQKKSYRSNNLGFRIAETK